MPEKTLIDFWIVLYKKKISIAIITAISVATAAVLTLFIKPVYEARAVFYVPESSLSLSYMSKDAADRMARGKLVPSPRKEAAGPYIGLLKSTIIAEYIHQEYPRKEVSKLLRSDVNFEFSNEFMLIIYSRDEDPVLAADVANAYMKYLNLLLQEASLKNADEDRSLLGKQLGEAEKNLQEANDEMTLFQEKNNIASLDEEIKNLTDQRISFQTELENARIQRSENSKKIGSTIEQLKKEGDLIVENDFLLTSPSIDYLKNKLSDLATRIAAASVELEKQHPDMKALRKEYKATSKRLKSEVQNLVLSQMKPGNTFYEKLRQDLVNLIVDQDKLQATIKGFTDTIDRINQRLGKLPSISEKWTKLNDKIEEYKKQVDQLKLDLQETEMQQARKIQYVVTVDSAKPPGAPSFPKKWVNVIVALLFGLLTGIFYAFVVNYIEEMSKIRRRKIIKEILSGE
ncbi:MAG: hypothetical protein A2Y81_12930 [Nitrospirae bacterium RBG_13_43_8]|nr:MAG: hypothetical protein A2Y81_12930 [Nitrospirae bacterium RBG_13_43_8]